MPLRHLVVPINETQTGRKWLCARRERARRNKDPTRRWRHFVWPLAALITSCRLSPVEGNASTQNVPGIPSYVEDEYSRIRLDWPGQGWQLLDSKAPERSGLCAYDEEQLVLACVSVAHAPSSTLEKYVDDWLSRLQFASPNVLLREPSEFQGEPASTFEVSGGYLGQPSKLSGVIFFHQGRVYRILVRGPGDRFDHTRFRRFVDNVHLLPGKVKDPPLASASRHESGPGWRLSDGLYESGIKSFKIAAGAGWSFVVGRELREFNPDADIVALHDNPDISLAVRVEPLRKETPRGELSRLQESHRKNLHVQLTPDKLRLQVQGASRVARLGKTDSGNRVAYFNYRSGDKLIELTAGFSELYRTAALPLIEKAANAIAIVPIADRGAFERPLLLETEAGHSVGREYSLRNGCFHAYAQGFAWCPPRGFWEFSLGDDARVNHDWAVLDAKNVQSGITFRMFSRLGQHEEPLFQSLAEELRLREVPPAPGSPFTRVALRGSTGSDGAATGDVDLLYAIAQNGGEIAALISCDNHVANCRLQSEALVKGFRAEDRKNAVDFTDSTLVDRRLGMIQKLPPSFRAKTHNELPMEGGQSAVWESPESSVTLVTALTKDAVAGTSEFLRSVDRATRASVPPSLLRQKRSSSLSVAGEIAERQSFVGLNYRFDTVILRHEHVLLAWLVTSRNSDKLTDVLSGLSWIE